MSDRGSGRRTYFVHGSRGLGPPWGAGAGAGLRGAALLTVESKQTGKVRFDWISFSPVLLCLELQLVRDGPTHI